MTTQKPASINWISVAERVPEDRREVLAWGMRGLPSIQHFVNPGGQLIGATRYNPSPRGGRFDVERSEFYSCCCVTHWAEIEGPTV